MRRARSVSEISRAVSVTSRMGLSSRPVTPPREHQRPEADQRAGAYQVLQLPGDDVGELGDREHAEHAALRVGQRHRHVEDPALGRLPVPAHKRASATSSVQRGSCRRSNGTPSMPPCRYGRPPTNGLVWAAVVVVTGVAGSVVLAKDAVRRPGPVTAVARRRCAQQPLEQEVGLWAGAAWVLGYAAVAYTMKLST
jgi:hypothetical protein